MLSFSSSPVRGRLLGHKILLWDNLASVFDIEYPICVPCETKTPNYNSIPSPRSETRLFQKDNIFIPIWWYRQKKNNFNPPIHFQSSAYHIKIQQSKTTFASHPITLHQGNYKKEEKKRLEHQVFSIQPKPLPKGDIFKISRRKSIWPVFPVKENLSNVPTEVQNTKRVTQTPIARRIEAGCKDG